MSFISLSLRLNRRLIVRAKSVESNLLKCHSRTVHLSAQLSEKDSSGSDEEKVAREKLNQLLKDIKEAKSKRKEDEVKGKRIVIKYVMQFRLFYWAPPTSFMLKQGWANAENYSANPEKTDNYF